MMLFPLNRFELGELFFLFMVIANPYSSWVDSLVSMRGSMSLFPDQITWITHFIHGKVTPSHHKRSF